MSVNVNTTTNTIVVQNANQTITIVDNENANIVNVTQPLVNVIEVASPGPQGPAGPAGPQGPSVPFTNIGNNIYATTSSLQVTGSFLVSGSSTFTNIGPAIFSGSVNSQGGFTGSLQGTASFATTASFALAVAGGGGAAFPFTGSARITGSLDVIGSTTITGSLNASAGITGSLLGTASAAITVEVNDVPGNNATNYLAFYLSPSGFRPTRVASTKFVVNPATGSMGINKSTITTGYNLDVNGSVLITGSLVVSGSITGSLFGTASWAINALTASFINTASTNAFVQGGNSFGTTALLGTNDNQSLAFETSGSTRMFVSSSGNVGIGTSTPTNTLDVSGSARITNGLTVTGSVAFASSLTVTSAMAAGSSLAVGTFSPAVASAQMEIVSTTRGFLPPRTATTASITSPAQGLITYLTGSTNEGLYYYNSGSQVGWHKMLTNTGSQSITGSLNVQGSVSINTTSPSAQLQVKGSGATSATTTFLLQNSTPTNLLSVLDNGQVSFTSPTMSLAASQSAFSISPIISASNIVGGQYYGVSITPTFFQTTGSQTETAFRVAATFTSSNATATSGTNIIADFGSTSAGSQLTVTDVTSGSIYMVNDVSGIPIIEATSNWDVNMYDFPNKVFEKTGSQVNIYGTMRVSGSFILPLSQSVAPQTGSAYWSGSLLFIYDGTRYRSSSFA